MSNEILLASLEMELDELKDQRENTSVGSINGQWVAIVLVAATIYFLFTLDLLVLGTLIGIAVILLVISQRNLMVKDKVELLDIEIATIREEIIALKELQDKKPRQQKG